MPLKIIQFRGGTSAEHTSFTGHDREVTVDTTEKRVRVHDGSTAGGHGIAKESEIPTATNQLTNDVYRSSSNLTKLSQLTADVAYWKKSELVNVSQLTNDKKYIAGHCSHCTYCAYCTHCS